MGTPLPNKKNIEDNLSGIPSRVPDLRPGKYKDGTPLHEVQFLECKIILKRIEATGILPRRPSEPSQGPPRSVSARTSPPRGGLLTSGPAS